MTTKTLSTRIYDANQLRQIETIISRAFEGLNVETKGLSAVAGRWVQLDVSGEDEAIASNYLAKNFGFCPSSLEKVKRFSVLKGYIINLEKSKEDLHVDVGVFEPNLVYAAVPLRNLQAQLVDGRKVALKKILELFGFCNDFPINVKVRGMTAENDQIDAELPAIQVERYGQWTASLLDRLIIIGSSLPEVKRTINSTGLKRDIVNVEPLGMFEQALTCKLGTDAAGLISPMGQKLQNARFSVFNPKRITEFLEKP